MKKFALYRFCFLLLSFSLSPTWGATRYYTFKSIGPSLVANTAVGLNNSGVVGGTLAGDAFTWEKGIMRFDEDPTLGFPSFEARGYVSVGVDDSGAVGGYVIIEDTSSQIFRLDKEGLHFLDQKALGWSMPIVTCVGPNGQMGGYYAVDRGYGMFLTQGNVAIPFSVPGWKSLVPLAINRKGWMAGFGLHNDIRAGFLLVNGKMTDLGSFFPGSLTDQGDMLNSMTFSPNPTVRIAGRTYTVTGPPGYGSVRTRGMNNSGVVVGEAVPVVGTAFPPQVFFTWTLAGGPVTVQTDHDGYWDTIWAAGINDAGQIAANMTMYIPGPHGVLLTPIRTAAQGSKP